MLKKLSGVALVLVLLAPVMAAKKNNAKSSQARIAKSAKYLSSDDLEGRGVGTKGLNKAADYIRKEFTRMGLKAKFQKFKIPTAAKMGKTSLAIRNGGGSKPAQRALKIGQDFYPLAIGGSGKINAPIVFAGYGITSKEADYDDYKGLNVKGKVVLIIRKEPQQDNPHSKFDGTKSSSHAFFVTKVENASKHGAAAVIMINDNFSVEQSKASAQARLLKELDKLVKIRVAFTKKKKVKAADRKAHAAAVQKQLAAIAKMQEQAEKRADALVPFQGAGSTTRDKKMPVFFAKRGWAEAIIKHTLKVDLKKIEAAIDKDLKPRSAQLSGYSAVGETAVVRKVVEVKNVIGVLEGQGPLANETIVVGAHYDHLGRGGAGSLARWTKAIHNGADDNASGTAALLEVAHQLTSRSGKTRRRIVFIAFTAEEMGLIGSRRYCRSPMFPLEDTIAMFNMDMVGRLRNERLVVFGTGTAKGFDKMVDSLNKEYGFKIKKNPSGYGPSDHQSFYEKKIPVLHLFTDTHRDYHRPSDDFGLLNLKGMQRIASMFTDIVLHVDKQDARPQYLQTKRPQRIRTGNWPDFGSIPDYAAGDEVKGMRLQGVRKGSPADKAGLREGDIMVKLGKFNIKSVEDFARALGRFKAGQKVKVIVNRKGAKATVTVTLGKRR